MANEEYFEARNKALEELVESVNQQQVGGKHYKLKAFQHWDFVISNRLGYFEGQITKYICRWREKNGVQDLEKAMHYLAKLIGAIRAGKLSPAGSGMPNCVDLSELKTSYPQLSIQELRAISLLCDYPAVEELFEVGALIDEVLETAKQK